MSVNNLQMILFFMKNYKRYIVGIFIFSILYAVFEGLNIAVLFPIIESVINIPAKATMAYGILNGLNALIRFIPVKDTFIAACILVIIVSLLKNIFRYLYMILSAYGSCRAWDDLQNALFNKYIHADYGYLINQKQGEIVYRLYNAPAAVGGILKLIPNFLTEVLKILVIGVILFSMSFSVTCGVIVIGGIFYFFTKNISRKISYSLGKKRIEATEEQIILINEMINGIKQIKVFLGEAKWVSNFNKAVAKYFKLIKQDTLWSNMPQGALEIFALTTLSIFLIFVRRFSPSSLISNLPLLGVFAYAFQRIMPSLSLITNIRMQIMGELPAVELLYRVINEEMSHIEDGTLILNSFHKGVEFRNVSFSYPGRRNETLKNISILFHKNKSTAIVGASGSGKTTIVNLFIRLSDPTQGQILIDGIDIRSYKKDSWLGRIGFVSQDTFIFHAAVRDNIAFGLGNADMEDIVKAAKMANAHDFILGLPNAYDTIVGERGMKLSGGEQQRIAIARAILRNPEILIFDEATSALDNVSQSLIQDSINKIIKDHTVILIAHRLSTILHSDNIIVFDKGEVREEGSHSELMLKKNFYWRLYNNEKSPVLSER